MATTTQPAPAASFDKSWHSLLASITASMSC